MADFKQLLKKTAANKTIDPVEIFISLEKKPEKAHLWAAQEAVLREWHQKFRNEKDTIVKLHTGQGKTLIGLLMLQSCLNEGKGPALYLCPNDYYLVHQTMQQAESFGIKAIETQPGSPLPKEFKNGEAILVAPCSKLFNGKSVFGVDGSGKEPFSIGSIVLDDAHRCLDNIRSTFSAQISAFNDDDESRNPLYDELYNLFKDSLEKQARGTFADITQGHDECILCVPYWSWNENIRKVLSTLHDYKDSEELTFVWDLLKNHLEYCDCIFSGRRIEIVPRITPIQLIPSFTEAKNRFFLSATLNEDAFLIKDLDVNPDRVANPLSYSGLKYSGERLILIPSVIDPTLSHFKLIEWITEFSKRSGNFGIFCIVPSKTLASHWDEAIIPENLDKWIEKLKEAIPKKYAKQVTVLVNKYDGVDLPGDLCRVLVLDSLPAYNSLIDRYHQSIRSGTSTLKRLQAQRIEQGMGRGIRGSTDHCVVLVIGTDISEFLSENSNRKFLSVEAQKQIEIGEEVAELLKTGTQSLSDIEKVIDQCIQRDKDWRDLYNLRMSKIDQNPINREFIDNNIIERNAEKCFQKSQPDRAIAFVNQLVEKSKNSPKELGWYLQLKAQYQYSIDPTKGMDIQIKAFETNSKVFRPPSGIRYSKISHVGTNRAAKIKDFLDSKESRTAIILHIERLLEKLSFNLPSDLFEEGIDELGEVLGFTTQRPDKTYGEGPDNLWDTFDHQHMIIECKNEVERDRGISRDEANQLSGSISWFNTKYPDSTGIPVIIHPSNFFMTSANTIEPAFVIQPEDLEKLKRTVKIFYNSLAAMHSESISIELIKQKILENHLDLESIKNNNLKRIRIN
jgi:hypothetical protein